MKRLFSVLLLLVAMGATAQTTVKPDTAKFMNQYRVFVLQFDRDSVISRQNYQRVDSVYRALTQQYRQTKPYLSNAQVEEYNALKGRYAKRVLEYRGDRVAAGLEATGDTLMRKTERARKAIGGWFRGVLGK